MDEREAFHWYVYSWGLTSIRWRHDPGADPVFCNDCGHREFATSRSIAGHNRWHNQRGDEPGE